MDPGARLTQLISGYRLSQALHVAAVLGISDLLVDGPRSVEDLASAADADPGALRRLLQALAAEEVYVEDERGWFANNALSSGLRRDTPGAVGPWARFAGEEYHWRSWGHLLHSVRTGETAFQDLYGTDVWTYRSQRPERNAEFDRYMVSITETVSGAVVEAYDFSAAHTVVDVAGGAGALLGAVLAANPHLTGVLFDQQGVVERAAEAISSAPWGARCRLASGSMFEGVPSTGDVYLMKSILHDWPDEDCVKILSRCREVMADSAVLLIVEHLIEGPNHGAATKFSDLNMMVMLGGRERSEAEFADLCARAGLRLERSLPTGTSWFVLEAVRA